MASLDKGGGGGNPQKPHHHNCHAYILSYCREQSLFFHDTATKSNEIRVLVGVSPFLWPIFTYYITASKADLKLWEPVHKKYLPSSSQLYQHPFSESLHLPSIRTHSNSPAEESNCPPWRKVPHLSQESRRQIQNYFFHCWNGRHLPMRKQCQIAQNSAKRDQTLGSRPRYSQPSQFSFCWCINLWLWYPVVLEIIYH